MSDTHPYSSDVAFTPAVKAIQEAKGSRAAYAHVEARGGWRTEIDEHLAAFVAEANSMYLATASADGQPYIQHRGGPKGFVRVLDKNTLAFADYSGNRQYITQGNLSENPKAHLFLMDYAHRRRVKIWGEARVVDDDPAPIRVPPANRIAAHILLFILAVPTRVFLSSIAASILRDASRSLSSGAHSRDPLAMLLRMRSSGWARS